MPLAITIPMNPPVVPPVGFARHHACNAIRIDCIRALNNDIIGCHFVEDSVEFTSFRS